MCWHWSPREDGLPTILVRDLEEATVERFKTRGRQHGRSSVLWVEDRIA